MADSPQEPHRHAGQVVRRVLRRNIAIDRETARLAAAVQAALRAGPPSRPPTASRCSDSLEGSADRWLA
jgi:hypothetical protein